MDEPRTFQFTIPADNTAPPAPATVTATALSSTEIKVDWSASVDPDVPGDFTSGMAGYRIFRDGQFAKNVGLVLTWTDTGLQPDRQYSYRVKAVDAAGNASAPWSNAALATTTPPAPTVRRLPVGHWTAMLRGNRSQASMSARLVYNAAGTVLITKVMEKRYTWRQLEPTLGNYAFMNGSIPDETFELVDDLAWAVTEGVQLVVLIETKTFLNSEMPGPAYLDDYTVEANNGDRFVAIWDPYVLERFKALLTALSVFDTNPAFGGVSTQETAMGSPTDAQLGIGSAVPSGKLYDPYTTTLFRDAHIDIIEHHDTVFPNTYIWWHSNFIRENTNGSIIGEIIEAVKALGNFSLGGPDILPGSASLENRFYPFYETYDGQFPLLIEAQVDSYSHPDSGPPFYSMLEMFLYARDTLHANIVVWTSVG